MVIEGCRPSKNPCQKKEIFSSQCISYKKKEIFPEVSKQIVLPVSLARTSPWEPLGESGTEDRNTFGPVRIYHKVLQATEQQQNISPHSAAWEEGQ